MACGQAVVATASGGLTDIVVDGETGLLVPPGDVGALRDAMRRLIDDEALRQQFGSAGLQRVRQFQAGTVVPQIEAIYRQLRHKRAVRRRAARQDLASPTKR
jgi:glycosyltransferase involved in cell wall biosynthesis